MFYVFEISLYCSPGVNLFDKKHSIIVKYYYNIKDLFSTWIYVTLSVKSRLKSQNLIMRLQATRLDFKHSFHYNFNILKWPYSVNFKDIKDTFSQNVLYIWRMILCRKQ